MEHKVLAPLAVVALATIAPSPALAADDTQIWTQASVGLKLSDKWRLANEFVARFGDAANGLYEVENSTLVGYQVNDKVSAWAGYVHNPTYVGGDFVAMEHRLREQLVVDNVAKLGRASLGARLRMEQRWRDGVDGTAWRMRPYVKLSLPLGGKTAPTLNVTHEEFINLNNTSFQSVDGFDRMRNAVSMSMPLSKVLKAEVGYLNQYRFVRSAPDTMDHALTTAISFSF